jgi:hypothetical protein
MTRGLSLEHECELKARRSSHAQTLTVAFDFLLAFPGRE